MAKKQPKNGTTADKSCVTRLSSSSHDVKVEVESHNPVLARTDPSLKSFEPGDQLVLDDLEELDILEYFRAIDLESGDFIPQQPFETHAEHSTFNPIETEQISQWNLLRAVQLRLAYLRVQSYHRNSIHRSERSGVYATLCLTHWTEVFLELKDNLRNQSLLFRSTLCAIGRWRETAKWVREAIDAARECRLLHGSPIGAKVLVALEMVMSALRVNPSPELALLDKSLDSDKRRRLPILMIRRSLCYLDQSCRSQLLEAEASIAVLAASLSGKLPAPVWMDAVEVKSFLGAIRKKQALDEDDLKKARAAYAKLKNGQTMKNSTLKSLGFGSSKAQAIKEKMRIDGIDESLPRKTRRNRKK